MAAPGCPIAHAPGSAPAGARSLTTTAYMHRTSPLPDRTTRPLASDARRAPA